jgi:UDPglucose 6-dehydrogenase
MIHPFAGMNSLGVELPWAENKKGRAMKIVMIGTGYVGLVTGACLADVGGMVTCVDVDDQKVERLRRGELPIYEPGLAEVVARCVSRGRLNFSSSLTEVLRGADAVFICVGTPPKEDGSADLQYVEAVARQIGSSLEHYTVVVTKSTVPVGTAALVRRSLSEELGRRGVDVEFDVASNPEFLKEGAAISDFMKPDRIVIGVESDRARAVLSQVYRPFVLNGHPIQFMDVPSAELTKYAANAMLAVRISFMNMVSQMCDELGADVTSVRQGIASDPRIGSQFLYPGIGYGGSCFPKDVRAMVSTGVDVGVDMSMLQAVEVINDRQKMVLVDRVEKELGGLAGRHIAMWGLAFKPNTDDVREAPALAMIPELIRRGATVAAYDPVAIEQARLYMGDVCTFASDSESVLEGADALILATEWPEFRNPDPTLIAAKMRGRLVLDGRNVLDGASLRSHGFTYICIGRNQVVA